MCRDEDADDDDDDIMLSAQPCYRQRVTYDVLCLSEEPGNKYRTVQNVTGSETARFDLCTPQPPSGWRLCPGPSGNGIVHFNTPSAINSEMND